MGTVKEQGQENREHQIKWLTEGIRNGSLKTTPEYDNEGSIVALRIELAGPPARRTLVDDPRRTKPI